MIRPALKRGGVDAVQCNSLLAANGRAASLANTRESLAVCIPTFCNPEGLRRLLASVGGQVFHRVPTPRAEVFIVDNDPAGSARAVVKEAQPSLSFRLDYCVEKERGIPAVRNRLVACAAGYDLIAFIDDDEEATPHWLDELLHVRAAYAARVVTGPVLPRFVVEPPAWAVTGGFYASVRRPTGELQGTFYTNNLLIERALLAQFSPPFERAMALSGGTDSLLAMRLAQRGIRAVWADEATVYEDVPVRRATMRWYLRRRYRVGNALVLCDRFLPRRHYRGRAFLSAVGVSGLGIAVTASALWRGRHKVVRGVGYLCLAAGMLAGAVGRIQAEYGRDDYR